MEFLKVLWNNLRKGPVTDPFPFGETFTPKRFRGKVEIDPHLCVGCGTCRHVCAAGAINISKLEDGTGFDITVWHNTCCLCGQCRHYCPTKAITLSNDWHNAHRNTEKYNQVARAHVLYDYCASCGAKVRFLPPDVLKRIYADHPEIDVDVISRLCPSCRRLDLAVEEDVAHALAEGTAAPVTPALPASVEAPETPETVPVTVAAVAPEIEVVTEAAPVVTTEVAAEPVVEEPKPVVAAESVVEAAAQEPVVAAVAKPIAEATEPLVETKLKDSQKAKEPGKPGGPAKNKSVAKGKPSAKAKKSY